VNPFQEVVIEAQFLHKKGTESGVKPYPVEDPGDHHKYCEEDEGQEYDQSPLPELGLKGGEGEHRDLQLPVNDCKQKGCEGKIAVKPHHPVMSEQTVEIMDSAGHDENIEEIHIREYAEHHGKGKGLGNIVEVSPEIEGQRKNGGEHG
jgi:hypothetical protein